MLANEAAEQSITTIDKAAKSNGGGAGEIFVLSIMKVVRIRTGEHGKDDCMAPIYGNSDAFRP